MSHQRYSELCPIYALGALDGDDLKELVSHLESRCPECEEQIRFYSNLVARLPEALPDTSLPASLKQRLMEQIQADSEAPGDRDIAPSTLRRQADRPSTRWFPWALAAAALLLVTVSATFYLNRQLREQEAQLNQKAEQIQQLQEELRRQRQVMALLQRPDVRITSLAGTPKSPGAAATIVWSANATEAYFVVSHLPVAPADRTYQLWLITDRPISAGIFDVNPDGRASLQLSNLIGTAQAQKFAVTLEPSGGVPQPTGEMHLLGSI
ncbi:MAG: anti-sigma factor [Acidobacteriota bacterium]